MSNELECSKCQSENLARVVQKYAFGMRAGWFSTPVPVVHYVCLDCGFVEQWIEDEAGIAKLQKFKIRKD